MVQQPAAQQPIVVQQPAPASSQPLVIQPPADTRNTSAELDHYIEMEFERQMMDNPNLAGLAVTVTSAASKVTLKGTVASQNAKTEVEKLARAITGVKDVDNQIVVNTNP